MTLPELPRDRFDRPLQDLRISVIDQCNFRCSYCMPKHVFDKNYPFLAQNALLSFEEIARLAKLFVTQGVTKIRLTGGEPLLRPNLERLIEMLNQLTTPTGQPIDLTLTTNGTLLTKKARVLKEAGLQRITVSLDALDQEIFTGMTASDLHVTSILHGIDAAHNAGLEDIKINMVVKQGVNEGQIIPMARHFKNTPYTLRFIEYMDVGKSNGWRKEEVVTSGDILAQINAQWPLEQVDGRDDSETAQRWRYLDGSGEIGTISSVSQPFCTHCTRLRLSPDGKLFTCLFATSGFDIRQLLRENCSDQELTAAMAHLWRNRDDRYSLLRRTAVPASTHPLTKIEMSYIGG